MSLITSHNFPFELGLAVIAQESRETHGREGGAGGEVVTTSFNNAHRTYDGGYGLMQITTPSFIGRASKLKSFNEVCTEFRRVYVKPTYLPEYICSQYTNTYQGIFANIKDGLRSLQDKFAYVDTLKVKPYMEGGNVVIDIETMKNILAVRGYNGFGTGCMKLNNTYNPYYLSKVAKRLRNVSTIFSTGIDYFDLTATERLTLADKFDKAEEKRTSISLCSPAVLQIIDSYGRMTNLDSNEIPNVLFDENSGKNAEIYFPDDSYNFNVVGTDIGTYALYVDHGIIGSFIARDIPTEFGAVHSFQIDWDALINGENGVTMHSDMNGDGVFEHTVFSGMEMTIDDFILQTETIIDFNPNTLNIKSKNGKSTVYIELPLGYDVENINPETITLNGVEVLKKPISIGDYDNDGILDFMVKFDRTSILKTMSQTSDTVIVTIAGELIHEGLPLFFKDEIEIKLVGWK